MAEINETKQAAQPSQNERNGLGEQGTQGAPSAQSKRSTQNPQPAPAAPQRPVRPSGPQAAARPPKAAAPGAQATAQRAVEAAAQAREAAHRQAPEGKAPALAMPGGTRAFQQSAAPTHASARPMPQQNAAKAAAAPGAQGTTGHADAAASAGSARLTRTANENAVHAQAAGRAQAEPTVNAPGATDASEAPAAAAGAHSPRAKKTAAPSDGASKGAPAAAGRKRPPADDEDTARGFHISKMGAFVAITAIVLVASGVMVFSMLRSFLFSTAADVEMPNFDGMNVSEIQHNAQYEGFHIIYEEIYSDERPEGVVVGQNPRAPRLIKENATITLRVSAGTRTVEVPNVTKVTREEAKQQLKDVGLNTIFKPVTDTTMIPDTVLNTVPAAGQSIAYGDTVQVFFTRNESSTKLEVPECIGMPTLAEAIRALAVVGFNYDLSVESTGEGQVTAQEPKAGEMMPRGTTIMLTTGSSDATGLDALPEKQVTGADGHPHEYTPATVVAPNSYSIGYTVYVCSVCNYFYYDDFTQPVG